MAGGQSWHTGGMSTTDPDTVAGTAEQAAGEPCVLLKLGEVVLKGRNRHQFERMLQANIRAAARDTGLPVELLPREGVVVLRVAPQELTPAGHVAAVDRLAERVSDVPGILPDPSLGGPRVEGPAIHLHGGSRAVARSW